MAKKLHPRQKAMLALVIILALYVVLDTGQGSSSSKTSGTSGLLDILNGNDRVKITKRFKNTLSLSELSKQKNHQLEVLRNDIMSGQTEFWSYTNGTSPRSLVQQEITRTLRSAGFSTNSIRVGIGNERAAKSSNFLQTADYPLSGTINVKELGKVADFVNALERKAVQYHWRSFQVTVNRTSSRTPQAAATMRFNATLRVYILNNKAVKLLSENTL